MRAHQEVACLRAEYRRECMRTMRIVIVVVPSLLLLRATATLSASQCDQTSTAVASHLRLAGASQSSTDHVANVENCRAYFKQFVEAVTARQAVATCQDGVGRQRALENLDVEIQLFNDRIAEQSCGQ
jgi:sulfur relay (sulfurtransferase) DsrC/TusE family protein